MPTRCHPWRAQAAVVEQQAMSKAQADLENAKAVATKDRMAVWDAETKWMS